MNKIIFCGIGHYVKRNKTELIGFKEGVISTISGKPLKLEDQFTYFGSNISSTESGVNIQQIKVWKVINWLLII